MTVLFLFINFVLFQIYFYQRKANNDLYFLRGELDESHLIQNLKGLSDGRKVYINDHNTDISDSYTDLIKDYGETFYRYPFHNRCSIYFNSLYQRDDNWSLTDFHELPYDGLIFERKDVFINDKMRTYKNENHKDMSDEEFRKIAENENLLQLYEIEYQKAVKESQNTEKTLIGASTHLRVFGACYLDQFGVHNKYSADTRAEKECYDIEMRMFPWLSRKSPVYKRWDGTELNTVPIMSKYTDQLPDYNPVITECYMKNLKHQLNGKGITISAKDDHFDLLAGLFSLLRALGNKLPIEIVHKGDMSKEIQKKLITVARMDTPDLTSVENLSSILKQRNVTDFNPKNKTQIAEIFPKQELWFVDVQGAISANYRDRFEGYANKLLAYFFSSFKNCILMDSDTVPVVDLEDYILNSESYQQDGAYFFKDRELFYQGITSDRKFFAKLMPSKIDTAMFSIPSATPKTLKNRFIGGRFLHYMESGLVAIDKSKHFTGVLTTLQLQIWAPAASKVWGDKELFWLGLSISGDENYHMNSLPAGSVGQITPKNQRKNQKGNELIGRELCGTHPAHVSGEDNSTLLWFNSGFQFCKKDSYNDDYDRNKIYQNLFENKEALRDYYKNFIKIDSVMIPKHAEFFVGNDIQENSRGWEFVSDQCHGYLFCAYDKVGGKDDPVSNALVIDVDKQQRDLYDFYGYVWINAKKIFLEPTTSSQ